MEVIVMNGPEKSGFEKAIDICKVWGSEHQAEIGVVEMAMGAGLIYWGLQSNLIQMGSDVVGSQWADIGGLSGASLGGIGAPIIAGTFLKSIFVGGVSGVAGVSLIAAMPVVALVGGGAAILGAFGYTAGDIVSKFVESTTPTFGDLIVGGSLVTLALALMIDGARRVINDERISNLASKIKDGVIQLAPNGTEIVAKSWDELQLIIKELASNPTFSLSTGASVAAGAAIGGSVAAGTVTVLGSHGLGALALSLGIVSAPILPVIAGGVAGLAIGVAAWKGVKHYRNKSNEIDDKTIYLPRPDDK